MYDRRVGGSTRCETCGHLFFAHGPAGCRERDCRCTATRGILIRVPPDPETLKQVASMTGGKFFAAADAKALKSVYAKIGSQVGVEHKTRELTALFTAAGALLLAAGAGLSMFWFARLP